GLEADDGHHSACPRAFFAIRKKQIGAARGAKFRDVDSGGGDAGTMKLGEVGRGEVEPGARVGTWPIEKSSAFRPALAKGIPDFRADFITAGTNRRSERGDEAPGTRAEGAAHRGDSCFGDPIERPSPARVDSRNGA